MFIVRFRELLILEFLASERKAAEQGDRAAARKFRDRAYIQWRLIQLHLSRVC